MTVALMEYPLCPAVSVAQIAQGQAARPLLLVEALTPAEAAHRCRWPFRQRLSRR
ncbi:MAG: hypothetical protein IPL88_17305 [Rhizobiales bacterium]|nr:hypothetical protein [Hyphomicrobiales bacterium]